MLIVQVSIQVKPESVDAFIAATEENARNSIQEPGIVRFDFAQQEDDPTRFSLTEIFRGDDDPARHRETAHYAKWKETVEPMMAEPRRGVRYRPVYSASWETPR
jgi:autoinducer 2-degrading protein